MFVSEPARTSVAEAPKTDAVYDYEPDEGEIEVKGRIAPLLDLSLGIDPSATGLENIRLRGRIAGLSFDGFRMRMHARRCTEPVPH